METALSGRNEVQNLRLEDIETGVDEIRVDLLRPRLLEEGLDATVGGRAHEAVAARVGDRSEQDRGLRARRAVEGDQLAEIGLAQRVPVEREEAPFELATGEGDGSSGTERLVLDRVLERHAVVLGAEPDLDLVGQVPARDDRTLHAVSRQVLERVREQRPVDEREHVLPRPVGERSEPRPLAADQNHRRERHTTGRPMPS